MPYKGLMRSKGTTIACPSCREEVALGNPMCGNCGRDMTSISPGSSPLGEPAHRRSVGIYKGVAVWIVFILIGTIGAGLLVSMNAAEQTVGPSPKVLDTLIETLSPPGKFPKDPSSRQYQGVKEVFAGLRSNRLKCSRARVQARSAATQSGSCSLGNDLLIITTYSEVRAFEILLGGLQQGSNSFVHGRNWLIIYTFRGTGKKIRRAIGGTVQENPDAPAVPSF